MQTKEKKEQDSKKVISPKVKSKSFFLWLDRKNANGTFGPIVLALVLMVFIWGLVSLVYYCKGSTNPVKKAFVDMVSPVTARNLAYESSSKLMPEGDCSGGKLVPVENERINVWYLFTVYVLGLVFFSGLFVATITNSLRTRADRFKQGMFKLHRISGHIVFLGYNEMVPGLIKRIIKEESKDSRKILVGVRGRADEIYNQICDQANLDGVECWRIVVFHVDNIYEKHLKQRLRVHLAKDVYIIGEEDDAHSLDAYIRICNINKNENPNGWIPECYVQMQYQSTFALFQTYSKKDMEHFHAFNFHDVWARQMVMREEIDTRERKSIGPDSAKQVHLVVIGMTEMGEALAREAAFLCHYPNYVKKSIRTRITFIDSQAKDQMTFLIGRYDHLFSLCRYVYRNFDKSDYVSHIPKRDFLDVEFEFIQANIASEAVRKEISQWATSDNQVLTIGICADMPHRSIAAGLYLPDEVFDNDIPVWVYQPAKGDLKEFLDKSQFENVTTFGMSGEDLDIKNTYIINQAMRLNHFYWHLDNPTYDALAIEKDWSRLTIYEKWSNVYNVSAIPAKKRAVNNDLEKNIDVISEVEHNRWNVEKLLMGFRPTTIAEHEEINPNGMRDNDKKDWYQKEKFVHDDIRPFAELNNKTKEIDRKFTKEIPTIIQTI